LQALLVTASLKGDGPTNYKHQAASGNKPQATSNKQQATSNKQQSSIKHQASSSMRQSVQFKKNLKSL
jgi:hypothetical protein